MGAACMLGAGHGLVTGDGSRYEAHGGAGWDSSSRGDPPLSSLLGLMSPHDHLLLEKTLLTWRPPGS